MNTHIDDFLTDEINSLDAQGLRRHLRRAQGAQSGRMVIEGKEVVNFCSNDYLGLANDARLTAAAAEAMAIYGFGSGASRLVCGNMSAHEELEENVARLKQTEACLVFNSGYAANTGIISAVCGRNDLVLSDKLNHASIVDGILLSRATMQRYAHADMAALEQCLKEANPIQKKLIVTDTVFSMDGDTAPLADIVTLARRYNAWVMVDEAHGFGVLGKHGGGLVEVLGLGKEIDIQMGTLSKAAGCFGAYVCGSVALREYLINHARSFIYTTSMPPFMAVAASRATGIIGDAGEGGALRLAVATNADYVRRGMHAMGYDTLNSTTPIIPVVVKEAALAVAISKQLLVQGIFVQPIRPPTVPQNTARLRITVTAAHTRADLDTLLNAMKEIRDGILQKQ